MEPSSSHLVSLKVMRVSRPAIASAWEPFYSSSPSFSAHSTASLLSLQGKTPLPGNPKTLRDLTHLSELLVLPPSFGAIQLGETFTSCLCVNNETNVDVESVSLRVEMQTSSSKVLLAEFGGPDSSISVHDTLECIVSHEIKELGQHVLACTVTYRSPPNTVAPPQGSENQEPGSQTFRKFYKFGVTNPLSVKTKVHPVRSPSATLSLQERDRIFLEVHIQNSATEPLWFERMKLECTDEWDAIDVNSDLFISSNGLMQPQDIRQYVYVLTPQRTVLVPITQAPGAVIPLGRLDISWHSSFGEPGRLLTSTLSRRIHAPTPPQNPASAIPPHLKRPQPTRPHSPQPSQTQPASPPPYRTRAASVASINSTPRPQTPTLPAVSPTSMFDVHLLAKSIPRDTIRLGKPFDIAFSLTLSTSMQSGSRRVTLAVQYIQPPRPILLPTPSPQSSQLPSPTMGISSSGFSTPWSPGSVSSPTSFNLGLAHQKLLTSSVTEGEETHAGDSLSHNGQVIILPTPFFQGPDAEARFTKMSGATFCGQSTIILPRFELLLSSSETSQDESPLPLALASHDFTLSWIPLRKGLTPIGGVRILLLEDHLFSEEEPCSMRSPILAKTLKEIDIVAEVWVSSS